MRARSDVYGYQVPGHRDLVQSYAANTSNFVVHAGVMMAEEAHAWSDPLQQHIEALRFANVTTPPTMPRESDSSRRIVSEDDVHTTDARELLNFVRGVVSFGVYLETIRFALEIR